MNAIYIEFHFRNRIVLGKERVRQRFLIDGMQPRGCGRVLRVESYNHHHIALKDTYPIGKG